MALVAWYLDLVARVEPPTWSMEQVPHPAVKALLEARGVSWTCVSASDFGVPRASLRKKRQDAAATKRARLPRTGIAAIRNSVFGTWHSDYHGFCCASVIVLNFLYNL